MRKTIVLVLIAAALGAYVYFYEIKGGEQRAKQKEAAEKLLVFNKDSVDFVEIQAPKGHFIFKKSPDGWQIREPVQTDADEAPIKSLLSNLNSAKKQRSFSADKNKLAGYGLDARALTIRLKGRGLPAATIKMGDKTSVGSNVYVTVDDSTVAMIPAYIKTSADKSLFDWRYKKAIHFKKDAIRQITLRSPKGTFSFVKDKGNWLMTAPRKGKADKSAVDALLNKLEWGRIKAVVAEHSPSLKKFGLARPAYRLELLTGAEKAKLGLSFSRIKNNTVYGKDDARPLIFKVDSLFMKPFNKNLFAFRDKSVEDFNREEADSISLFYKDSLYIVHKDSASDWRFADGKKAKGWKITNLLSALSNLKARAFVEEPARHLRRYGLQQPTGHIQVFSGGTLIAELKTGKAAKGDNNVYALNPRQKALILIEQSAVQRIFPEKKELIEVEKKTNKETAK